MVDCVRGYSTKEVRAKVDQYVAELDVTKLPSLGHSKYHLPDENLKGVCGGRVRVCVNVNQPQPNFCGLQELWSSSGLGIRTKAWPSSWTGNDAGRHNPPRRCSSAGRACPAIKPA